MALHKPPCMQLLSCCLCKLQRTSPTVGGNGRVQLSAVYCSQVDAVHCLVSLSYLTSLHCTLSSVTCADRYDVIHNVLQVWNWIMEPMLFATIGSSIVFSKLPSNTIPKAVLVVCTGECVMVMSKPGTASESPVPSAVCCSVCRHE